VTRSALALAHPVEKACGVVHGQELGSVLPSPGHGLSEGFAAALGAVGSEKGSAEPWLQVLQELLDIALPAHTQ
jgi:hypothetical protein